MATLRLAPLGVARGVASACAKALDRFVPRLRQTARRNLEIAGFGVREDIVDGLDNAPSAFIGLLAGKNFGKLMVRVSPDPTRA